MKLTRRKFLGAASAGIASAGLATAGIASAGPASAMSVEADLNLMLIAAQKAANPPLVVPSAQIFEPNIFPGGLTYWDCEVRNPMEG